MLEAAQHHRVGELQMLWWSLGVVAIIISMLIGFWPARVAEH
jgi:hypothetical protein